ncbi:MAG: STT3 domain-containing protein [Candidatus Woesearchaeota archaeon]
MSEEEPFAGEENLQEEPSRDSEVLKEDSETEKEDKKSEGKEISHSKKNHISKKERKHPSEENDEAGTEEVKIDWHRIYSTFKQPWLWAFLILIPLVLTIAIRIQPNKLDITRDWAQSTVYNYYKNMLAQQIAQQFPNLPEANRAAFVDQQFQSFLKSNSALITMQVDQTANYFKSKLQYDSNGTQYTYLGDLDSYYFLRYADNYLANGMQADEIRNGTYWDNHMLAPIGTPMTPTLHPYVIAWLYKILKIFQPKMTTMQASFYVPLVCAIIAAIVAFMIGKRLFGNLAGLAVSVLLAVNPMFLSRTMGSDTDVYNVMFPLLIIWMIIEALNAEQKWQKILFAVLSGMFVGIFALAWMGWWFIFDFLTAAFGIYIAYLLIFEVKKSKKKALSSLAQTALVLSIFILSSFTFTSIIIGAKNFSAIIKGPFEVMGLKNVAHSTYWPNVYLTVAELNPGSIDTIVGVMGGASLGILFAILAILGVVLFTILHFVDIPILKGYKKSHHNLILPILLIIWFFGTAYATYKGVRFALLFVPAFALAAGLGIGILFEMTLQVLSNAKVHKLFSYLIIAILLVGLMIPQIKMGYATGRAYVPSMNDAWYDALSKIKQDSAQNAIINSWWDFGHWFKYVADRAVTADGASQNSPQAYWLGRILVTDNEDEAIAILKMLDCGSNTAFEIIDKKYNDTPTSIAILRSALMLNRSEARKYLSNYLESEDVERVMQAMDCTPPEDYFITSGDMVGKAGVWAHFGLWDFEKAKLLLNVKSSNFSYVNSYLSSKNYSESQIQQLIYNITSLPDTRYEESWISPWPSYITQGYCTSQSENTTSCSFNFNDQQLLLVINWSDTPKTFISTGKNPITPYSLVYVENASLKEVKYAQPGFQYSVVYTPDNTAVICSPELAKSIFTRLFFLGGAGLNHFKLFDHERELTGSEIYVWKIDWGEHK